MSIKKSISLLLSAVTALTCMTVAVPEVQETASAAASYPVQKFRLGIGDTNRNVNISDTSSGSRLTSDLQNGTGNEKWQLNYISAGVYEIVNSATGYVITNDGGTCTLAQDTDGANQRWNITAVEKDFEGYALYYKVTSNENNSLALTFHPDGNYLTADSYNGDIYQKFKLNLDGLEGFAANAKVSGGEKAGTIGGLLGETVFVDTTEECVAAMKRTEPLTIVVTANLEFNDQPQENQKIEDDKTIIGSYSANTVYNTRWRNDDFYGDESITPSCNIVLQNMHFSATKLNSNNCGVILVYIYSGRNIWFDHCDFSATFGHNRDVEVGKFIWINTPVANWSDGCYNGISPDYITISYNHFNNRYWTVAYGTQNTETTRDRTTLMFNKWENCARRTPQIGNGTGHVYNSYHTYSISNPSQQIIAGDGCKMLTERCYFEGLGGLEFAGGGSSSSPFRDDGSISASSVGGSASSMNKSFSYSHSWNPGTENYAYTMITADNTKKFCNTYSGSITSGDLKYITDSDLAGWVDKKYDSPFLKDIEVSNGKPGAVIDTSFTYQIINANSNLYLEVANSEAKAGANVQQGSTGANKWTMEDAGNGYYRIYSELGDGKTYLLDVDYGKKDNGTNIGIYTDTAADAQLFKFVANDDGTYVIVTKVTVDAGCLGVVADSKEEGTNVVQWECNGGVAQNWKLKSVIDPIQGKLIKDLAVEDLNTYKSWSIAETVAVGDLVFGDRDVTYVTLPDSVVGAEYIRTACDAKNSAQTLATFEAAEDIVVYVGLDKRVTAVSAWLSDWTNTEEAAVNSKDVNFILYKKEFKKGDIVTLGTNGQSASCVNYTVFVTAAGTDIPETVKGDVNSDGVASMLDIVMVQKHLVHVEALVDTCYTAADLNADGKINVFDLVLLTQLLK